MIEVKELHRRWAAGHSNRKIARETGTDRDTVSRYIIVVEQLALPRDREQTEAEIHEVAQRVQARPLPDPSAERKAVAEHKQHIADWLAKKRPLRLSKIHTLLVRDHGLAASYGTLRRYAMEELGWHSFSRYQLVWPTFLQTTEAACEGLDRAWWFFGAIAKTIVPDNMSSVIKTADALNPTIVASFQDYAQARGIFVDPARVRSPKDKPRVENQVATSERAGATGRPSPTSQTPREAPSTGRARSRACACTARHGWCRARCSEKSRRHPCSRLRPRRSTYRSGPSTPRCIPIIMCRLHALPTRCRRFI